MSDKKPDFDSLDLSKLQKEKEEVAVTEEIQAAENTDTKPAKVEKPKRQLNAWIDGVSIEDVTAEDMVEWVQRLCGIEVPSNEMDTPRKRVKTIDKVLHIQRVLSYLNIGHTNKDRKEYLQ